MHFREGGARRLVAAAAITITTGLLVAAPSEARRTYFGGSGAISVPAGSCSALGQSAATPYPSSVTVDTMPSATYDIDVDVFTIQPAGVNTLRFLLRGPTGEVVQLVSEAALATLTIFDDGGETFLPAIGPVTSSRYKPTALDGPDCPGVTPATAYPGNSPAGPYGGSLSAFNALDPNGDWKLFVANVGPTPVTIASWQMEVESFNQLETDPPVVTTVVSPAPGTPAAVTVAGVDYYKAANVGITSIDSGEGLGSIQCAFINSSNSLSNAVDPVPSMTATFARTDPGKETYACKSTDVEHNVSATQTGGFVVDPTPPVTTISSTATNGVNPIVVSATDAAVGTGDKLAPGVGVDGIETTVDGGAPVFHSGSSVPLTLSAASHTVKHRAKDKLGNWSTLVTVQIVKDTTRPSAPTFVGTYLVTVQAGKPATLSGTAKDNLFVGSVKVRIRSSMGSGFDKTYTAACTNCTTANATWSLDLKTLQPPLPVGTYMTEITTTDTAGNVGPTTAGPTIVKTS